jgi:hypothetical protein
MVMVTVHYRQDTGELVKVPAPDWPCPIRGCPGHVVVEDEIHQRTPKGKVAYRCVCTAKSYSHRFFVPQDNYPSPYNRTKS